MQYGSIRSIPNPIQREVRQRCGFGCVICGSPIYHYDHMKEWAVYKRHVAKEITLLCPTHHQEKTNGLLSIETLENNNANPHNKRILFSPKWKINYGSKVEIGIGSMMISPRETSEMESCEFFSIPLVVGGQPIIWFNLQNGNLLLNITIFAKDRPILLIINNEVVYSTEIWDIEFVGRTLTIREGNRKIVIRITFDVNQNRIEIDKGKLIIKGREIIITNDYIEIDTNRFYRGNITGAIVGINC